MAKTVNVVKGSADEAILRKQYGDTINYNYTDKNQFVGADREATNKMYQEYLGKATNDAGDLDSYNGVAITDGYAQQQTKQQPAYQGLDPQAIADAWLKKTKAGINQSANQQLINIQNNLAAILSNLEAEKEGANVQNKKQLETIHNNEFATGEVQKELMNQSGWNPTNSGLAVGELGKIKVGADKQRADAEGALVQALNDIARRMGLAQTEAANNSTAVKNWQSSQLSSAAAEALLKGDELGYNRYRDSVADYQNNRNFDYQASIDDRNYNYQVGRDQVLDDQWMKQFTAQEQQRIIENAMQNRQISVSEGQLALQRTAQAWAENVKNPDNIYKQKQIEAMGSGNSEDYKTYLNIGLKMKDAIKEDYYENSLGEKEPFKTAKYTDKEIMDWVKGLDLGLEEKVKLLNALGIKE